MTTPIALTIAGSDSSGGAGIQADLKTFAALGVFGASVITALTAQNTTGVSGIHAVPAEFVTAQMSAVFSDLAVAAVKIGMVAQPASIDAIVAGLKRWSPKHIVLDPVMVATSGDRLLAAEAEIASEIYSTAGDYDLLVKFYVDNDTDIGHFVNEKVQVIPGIQDTHTIITFKAFGTR